MKPQLHEKPGKMNMSIVKRVAVLIIILTIPLGLSPVYGQPFWTEKSIYSDGEYLFAVGIATNVSNKEDGRIEAFDHGVREVCKLKGVTELPGLDIRTQMTYEEDHKDGTYTVYRLLKVKEDALNKAVQKPKPSSSSGLKGRVEPYVGTWPDGTLRTKGYLKKVGGTPLKTGKWSWWDENRRKTIEANYKDGLMHGKYIHWYENGTKKDVGEWRNGKQHGKVTHWYENGQKWTEAEYRDGKGNGKYISWYENGQKEQEGECINGEQHGKWTFWYENGRKKGEREFREGKPYGKALGEHVESTIWDKSGQQASVRECIVSRKEPEQDHDVGLVVRDGLAYKGNSTTPYTGYGFFTHTNGQKKAEGEYRDGKEYGKWTYWHENGQKSWEAEFRDGKEHGKVTYWYENGQKRGEGEWRDGQAHGKYISWHVGGQKSGEGEYRNGKKYGKFTRWHKNGQKDSEKEFRDDQAYGKYISWYENGQQSIEGEWRDGKQHGKWIVWNKTGQKQSERVYRGGKLISSTYWDENGEIKAPIDFSKVNLDELSDQPAGKTK